MKVRVYIGTTFGPVLVERIWREEGIAESMVCLQRTTEKLPISADYNDFVKRPTGIVEREFGPFNGGAFRLDLSGPINQGKSWQLAIFVAHAFACRGMLAGPDDQFECAIWLTGLVDNDLKITPVSQVPEKLHSALPELKKIMKKGKDVYICVPQDSAEILERADLPVGIVAQGFHTISEISEVFEIPILRSTDRKTLFSYYGPNPLKIFGLYQGKRFRLGVLILLLGLVALVAGVLLPSVIIPEINYERNDQNNKSYLGSGQSPEESEF